MLPFVGEYKHSVDQKGRMIVPSKFRNSFGEKVYLSKGFENCLLLLTELELKKIEEKIQDNSLSKGNVRNFMRVFFSGMIETTFDSQGRILIPTNLKEYASIIKDTVVIGTGFYVEIWDRETWRDLNKKMDEDRNKLSDILNEGMI